MLKKLLVLLAVIILTASMLLAEGEAAAPAAAPADADKAPAASVNKTGVKGWVVSVDENSIVIVGDDNQNQTFKVDKTTKFIDAPNNNAVADASIAAVDTRVRVDMAEGKETAHQVVKLVTEMVKPGAAKAEAAPAAAAEEKKEDKKEEKK